MYHRAHAKTLQNLKKTPLYVAKQIQPITCFEDKQ